MLRKSFLQHLSQNMNLILTCYLCMHRCAFELLDQTFFCRSFFHMDHITVLPPTPSHRSIQSPTCKNTNNNSTQMKLPIWCNKTPKRKPKETRLLRELWWWHVMVDSIDDKLNPWTALADGGAYWDFITFCLQWCVWMVSISNADVFHIGAGTPLCAITPIHESDAKCCQFSPDLVRASIILCFSCSSSLLQLGCQICFC